MIVRNIPRHFVAPLSERGGCRVIPAQIVLFVAIADNHISEKSRPFAVIHVQSELAPLSLFWLHATQVQYVKMLSALVTVCRRPPFYCPGTSPGRLSFQSCRADPGVSPREGVCPVPAPPFLRLWKRRWSEDRAKLPRPLLCNTRGEKSPLFHHLSYLKR